MEVGGVRPSCLGKHVKPPALDLSPVVSDAVPEDLESKGTERAVVFAHTFVHYNYVSHRWLDELAAMTGIGQRAIMMS